MPFDNSITALALPGACNVLDKWQCTDEVKALLLGFLSEGELESATSTPHDYPFTTEQAERMSYILNIYRSLHTFFEEPKRANDWVNEPNSAEIFGGKSALELMKRGGLSDLALVSNYLKAIY